MTTRRYRYRTPEQEVEARGALTRDVLAECYPFQRERIEILMKQGYRVYAGQSHGRAYVAYVSLNGEKGTSKVVCPDGSILGSVKGQNKFAFSWERMAALAGAPAAPGLVKAREEMAA